MEQGNQITRKELQILTFIETFFCRHGYPPTVREIGEAVGFQSSCSVHYYLKKMEKNGFIRRRPTKPRTIEVLPHSFRSPNEDSTVMIPLLRSLVLKGEADSSPSVESYVPLPRRFLGDGRFFILCWKGNANPVIPLSRGDYLICRKYEQDTAPHHDDVVLALIEEEMLLGRILPWRMGTYFAGQNSENHFTQLWSQYFVGGKVVGIWKQFAGTPGLD